MFIREVKDLVNGVKGILSVHVIKIMLLAGTVLVILPFCRYDKTAGFRFPVSATGLLWLLFVIGGLLLLGSILAYILVERGGIWKDRKRSVSKKPLSLTFGQLRVNIKVGKIQETVGLDRTGAIVLPANSTFIDECVTDVNNRLL